MRIRTHSWDYEVIGIEQPEKGRNLYLCRREPDPSGRNYILAGIKDMHLSELLIEYFTKETARLENEDFSEYFTFEGRLYVVFPYSSEKSLEEKLSGEDCSFLERLEMAKKLQERMVYLELPPGLFMDALNMRQITVSDSLDIRFNYRLDNGERIAGYGIRDIADSLAKIYRRLFKEELERKNCPGLKEYLLWLEEGTYTSYMDLYSRFYEVYETLKEVKEEDMEEVPSRIFKIWERIKKLAGGLRTVLAVVFVIGACMYLIYNIILFLSPKAGETVNVYQNIGTMEIRQTAETNQEME